MRVERCVWQCWMIAWGVLGTSACDRQAEFRPNGRDALTSASWIDATATLDSATTPVYEGDAPMSFQFLKDMRKSDGFTLSKLSLGAHSGTHVDAPMHFVRDGASIDRVPLEALIGRARVIEIPDSVQSIDAAELNRHQWRDAERVIFRRGELVARVDEHAEARGIAWFIWYAPHRRAHSPPASSRERSHPTWDRRRNYRRQQDSVSESTTDRALIFHRLPSDCA